MTNGTDLVKRARDAAKHDAETFIMQGYAAATAEATLYGQLADRIEALEAHILKNSGMEARTIADALALQAKAESSLAVAMKRLGEVEVPRPLEEWHEDMGDQLWWKFPIVESPYCGSPLDLGQTVEAHGHIGLLSRFQVGGWPGYHTHFTPIPRIATIANEATEKENGRG